jgi:hypothetical protein
MAKIIELFGSRAWSVDRSNITKDFSFAIHTEDLGEFVDAAVLEDYNGIEMLMDDNEMQFAVFQVFSPVAPPFLMFPMIEDELIVILTLSSIKATQINWETWRLDLTYDIEQGGENQGGGASGPSNGEANSTEFTQLSFNSTLVEKKIQTAIVREVQKSSKSTLAALVVPPGVAVGQLAFLGLSEEGIEGATIYEREFSFSITQYMAPTKLTYEYVRRISRISGCLNSGTWFGFPRGSVMAFGASGAGTLYQRVPVTIEFQVKPNFKLVEGATSLQPITDTYVGTAPNKTFTVTDKFDQIDDRPFPTTAVDTGLPGGAGVHSGWSIVDYRRVNEVNDTAKTNMVVPWLRIITQPYEYRDYAEYQL